MGSAELGFQGADKSQLARAESPVVIALRSLPGLAKPDCGFALQRKARQSLSTAQSRTFSPVRLAGKIPEIAAISGFLTGRSQVSLQCRLRGGEGGIRTLDTGVSPYNGLAIVSAEATPSNPKHLQSPPHTKSHPM